jgi:hypothetical protein
VEFRNEVLYVNAGVKIHGTGTINGGYIQASYYQDIFDTTLTVNIKGGATSIVSTSWFGCSPSKSDNTRYFQKAINSTVGKDMTLYTPAGVYNDSTFLLIYNMYNGDYSGVGLKWKGDYTFNGATAGTVINCLNKGNFAVGIQRGKGVTLEGLAIVGQFKKVNKPAAVGINYYNIAYGDYADTTVTEYYSGIIVDPYNNPSGQTGGSTGILFKDMMVSGFTTLFRIGNTSTLNAEEIIAERIVFGMGRTGWYSTQAQEKQNVIRNSMAWDGLHTFFASNSGNGSGNYHIHDINVAGGVVRLFDIQQSGWFPTKIDHIYAESIGSIGTLYTSAMIISVTDCDFNFAYKSEAGIQYLAKTNSLNVKFTNCDFAYFGQGYDLTFSGIASYIGCSFSGAFTNSAQGSVFSSNCQFRN